MIIPSARLLFWFAVVVLPFAVLGAVYPEAFLFSVGLIAAFVGIVFFDAMTAARRLEGLAVELPEILRVSKNRPASIPVTLRNPRQRPLRLRFGLVLPGDLDSTHEDLFITLPANSESSRFDWNFQPSRRGRHRIEQACLETASRLGFWAVRGSRAIASEVRVYPNLLAERKNLAALFLNRGTFGLHAQRQMGKGRDFEKLRDYVSGDGYDEIHWKATARRGHPVTKVFQIERTQEVYVVVDTSRLSARRLNAECGMRNAEGQAEASEGVSSESQNSDSVLERFLTSALILGQAAARQGDLFGLITFADQVQTFLPAKNGKAHYAACRDVIYTLQAQNVTPDFDEISAFIRTRLRRRALLIFLTSLDDPVLAESFVRNMSLLAGQHLVLVNMIKPPGADPLFSQPEVREIHDLYCHLGGHLRWHNLRELEKILQRRGVRFSVAEHENLATEMVSQYVSVKQRQLL